MHEKYQGYGLKIDNAGVNGDKARDGYRRLDRVLSLCPDVVIVGFGLNDLLKDGGIRDFEFYLRKIVDRLAEKNIRTLLSTLNPICKAGKVGEEDTRTWRYNKIISEIAAEYALILNDVYQYWKERLNPFIVGLIYDDCDLIHPNHVGYALIAERLSTIVPRSITRLLWQFNGANAQCNYRCPYCYQPASYHEGHHFRHDVDTWRAAFRETFRKRRLNFYLSFGEPFEAERFDDIISMIESEERWTVIILTNLSHDISRIVKKKIVKDGRLFLVASFHPTMTTIEPFVEKILYARKYGVEIPVVYVMWPPQINKFERDFFPFFQKHKILVHVRRFRGQYNRKHYPESYGWDEIKTMAKYMDDMTIRYMLCDLISSGKESFAGMSYLGVSNNGELWVCPDWPGHELNMGNIINGTARLPLTPIVLGGHFSDGTTDGIANLLETGMDELDDNHILSYCRQLGFEFDGIYIKYPNYHTDFDDPDVQERLGLGRLKCNL